MSTGRRRVQPADVSRWAREIVARRLLIAAAVAAVAHLLVGTGLVPDGISEQAELWTVSVIDAVALVGAIFWVRTGTTPADPALAPTSSNGEPLVEVPAQHRRTEDGERLAPSNVHLVEHADRDARERDPLA
jgi:hypothetical protein